MKNRVLVLLIVLALSALSGLGIASAQGGAGLKGVTPEGVTLFAEPSEGAEVVAELAAGSTFTVTATDGSGAWLAVEAAEGTGYVRAEGAVVLNNPLLAPKVYVATNSGATALFATPDITGEPLISLSNGTVASVLGASGVWAYVLTPYGYGWSIAAAWDALPEGAQAGIVSVSEEVGQLGVFTEPKVGADLVGTVSGGSVLYWLGAPEGEWVEVLLPDGQTGYALANAFEPLPTVLRDTVAGSDSAPALYAAPDFAADIVATLEAGTPVTVMAAVDDFWVEVYHPQYGIAYAMSQMLGPAYTTATVQVQNAVVRAGPNDNLYKAIALLPAGTQVVVKGVSETGAWVQVEIPFERVTYGFNGVAGWMRDFLFEDAQGNTDLDTSILSVTE